MEAAAQPSAFEMFLPFILIFAVSYFLIIRPQGRKLKEHEKFVSDLKRGDAVVTASGILGNIDGITDHVVTLDVGNGIKFKVLRKQVAGMQSAMEPAVKKT